MNQPIRVIKRCSPLMLIASVCLFSILLSLPAHAAVAVTTESGTTVYAQPKPPVTYYGHKYNNTRVYRGAAVTPRVNNATVRNRNGGVNRAGVRR